MTIIEKIKALFALNSFVNTEIKEAKMQTESGTPGYKTTEFWFHLAAQLGVFWGAVQGFVPPKYAAIIAVVGATVYNAGRVVAKGIADFQTARLESTTVTTTAPVTTVTTPG